MARLKTIENTVLKWIFGEPTNTSSTRLIEALLDYFYPDLYGVSPKCPFCGKTFKNRIYLKIHITKHRKCKWCYKLVVLDLFQKLSYVRRVVRNDGKIKVCEKGSCMVFRNYREALEYLYPRNGTEKAASVLPR